jgi:hypothetical protein
MVRDRLGIRGAYDGDVTTKLVLRVYIRRSADKPVEQLCEDHAVIEALDKVKRT